MTPSFATMRSSVRSRLAPPFLNNLQARILRLGFTISQRCGRPFDPDQLHISQRLTDTDFAIMFHNVPLQFTTFDWSTLSSRMAIVRGTVLSDRLFGKR